MGMDALLPSRNGALRTLFLVALVGTPAHAADAAQRQRPEPEGHRAVHPATVAPPADESSASGPAADDNVIVVTAHPPIDFGLMAGTESLEGDRLVAFTRGQIGEMLARLPGVSATSFAPGASRPVLRGLDGDRVRVLVDGIGSIDASNVSADHAVVFDPLTIDHIDVLHGPAVLLFGGQAIGGAVNALDKRIPRQVPDKLSGTVIGGYGGAADERSIGGAVDVPLGDRFVAHVDANWRKSDDVRVGGFVNSPALRQELLDEAGAQRQAGDTDGADELTEAAGLRGRIPNSGARSYTLGAGLAFIDQGGNLGVSIQRYDSRYGVPLRPGGGADEPPVNIGLVQTRLDLRGGLSLGGGLFDNIQFRGAYGDYHHTEFEGDEAGTRFSGKGVEFRTDLIQADRGGWRGRSGLTYLSRKMSIVGDEAFVPDNQVDRLGFFTLQSLKLGAGFELEGAGRYETVSVKAAPVGFDRSFGLWSGAAGMSLVPAPGWKIGANYIRGARAPSPEELLSEGLHVATQSYERGSPAFAVENSKGVELYARYATPGLDFSLTGYQTDFAKFIAARPTGEVIEGLPVFQYSQLPARFRGFEASANVKVIEWADGSLRFDAAADYTRARLKGVGTVPRIPPLRLRGGAEVQQGSLHLRGEVEWNQRQSRVAAFELPVPAFTLVNLSADWHPLGEDSPVTLMLAADNLLNVVGRRAASFTRDFVPLPGRDIRATVKLSF
jgi:iron complex outermembrane receptor protein